jgi:hypothetical protein
MRDVRLSRTSMQICLESVQGRNRAEAVYSVQWAVLGRVISSQYSLTAFTVNDTVVSVSPRRN